VRLNTNVQRARTRPLNGAALISAVRGASRRRTALAGALRAPAARG